MPLSKKQLFEKIKNTKVSVFTGRHDHRENFIGISVSRDGSKGVIVKIDEHTIINHYEFEDKGKVRSVIFYGLHIPPKGDYHEDFSIFTDWKGNVEDIIRDGYWVE